MAGSRLRATSAPGGRGEGPGHHEHSHAPEISPRSRSNMQDGGDVPANTILEQPSRQRGRAQRRRIDGPEKPNLSIHLSVECDESRRPDSASLDAEAAWVRYSVAQEVGRLQVLRNASGGGRGPCAVSVRVLRDATLDQDWRTGMPCGPIDASSGPLECSAGRSCFRECADRIACASLRRRRLGALVERTLGPDAVGSPQTSADEAGSFRA